MNSGKQRPLTCDDLHQLQTPLFARLSCEELEVFVGIGQVRHYDDTAPLFWAGDDADSFYAVKSGCVHLFILTPEGAQSLVTEVPAGHSFAEAALFGAGEYPVNAEVQADSDLIRIDGPAFLKILRDNPTIGLRMLDSLLAYQTFLIHEIHHLKARSPGQRLASYLLSLLERQEWQGYGRLPVRKQFIASRIGIQPESLSRALRRMEAVGVTCDGDMVVITDEALLRRYCSQSEDVSLSIL